MNADATAALGSNSRMFIFCVNYNVFRVMSGMGKNLSLTAQKNILPIIFGLYYWKKQFIPQNVINISIIVNL